jgi:hypothetical protein
LQQPLRLARKEEQRQQELAIFFYTKFDIGFVATILSTEHFKWQRLIKRKSVARTKPARGISSVTGGEAGFATDCNCTDLRKRHMQSRGKQKKDKLTSFQRVP